MEYAQQPLSLGARNIANQHTNSLRCTRLQVQLLLVVAEPKTSRYWGAARAWTTKLRCDNIVLDRVLN